MSIGTGMGMGYGGKSETKGNTTTYTPSGFGYTMAGVDAIAGGINAYAALQQAKVAKENAELAKKAFAFNSAMDNKNLLNQGTAYNTALYQRGDIAAAGGGLTQEQRDAKIAGLKKSEFDTTAIPVG